MADETEKQHGVSALEDTLAREFPKLYAFFAAHPAVRPECPEHWERTLRVARNSKPILADLRTAGLDLVRVDQYTPPGTDRRPLYQTVLDWLPRIQDPLTLSICLSRLTEPGARTLVRKDRHVLLAAAREWNQRLRDGDRERTLAVLAQRVVKAITERDLNEVLDWATDSRLDSGARYFFVLGLERFAKKPGVCRDTLHTLVADEAVGAAAVWALAGALKAEALPLLHELRDSSPYSPVRKAAGLCAKKIEARLHRAHLGNASPAMLPSSYESTSIEFDTDCFPELLSALERGLRGRWQAEISEQLALSANQLGRGRRRFHIAPFTLSDGSIAQFGFGLFGEDEDVIVVEIHFDGQLRDAINSAMHQVTSSH